MSSATRVLAACEGKAHSSMRGQHMGNSQCHDQTAKCSDKTADASEKGKAFAEKMRLAREAARKRREGGGDTAKSSENWIANATKNKGALHRKLGIPADKKIPAGALNDAAKKGGKLGKEARLAKTLRKLNK